MADFSRLADAIKQQDHTSFLREYLHLIVSGTGLTLPTATNMTGVRDQWLDIILSIYANYSDEFLNNLTALWLRTIAQLSPSLPDSVPKQLLDILENRRRPEAEVQPAPTPEHPRQIVAGDRETVVSQISQDYYRDRKARAFEPPPLPELAKELRKSISQNDADGFLIYFLAQIVREPKPPVPMSSVQDIIFHQWEDIFKRRLGFVPERPFLEALSLRWFYLVNRYGLPINSDKLKELYRGLIKERDMQQDNSSFRSRPVAASGKAPRKTLLDYVMYYLRELFS